MRLSRSMPWASCTSVGSSFGRDVGPDVLLDDAEQLVHAAEQAGDVQLVADGCDGPLLARGAVEVGGGVACAGVCERLLAVHVLDARRDVQLEVAAAVVAWVAGVIDRVLDVDDDAAEGVDDVPEAAHVHLDVVVDVDAQRLADDALEGAVLRACGSFLPGKRFGGGGRRRRDLVDARGERATP